MFINVIYLQVAIFYSQQCQIRTDLNWLFISSLFNLTNVSDVTMTGYFWSRCQVKQEGTMLYCLTFRYT